MLNGIEKPIATGDGAALSSEEQLDIVGTSDAEIMLFDLV